MFKKIVAFVKEMKVELSEKTNWPTRDEVLNLTVVVVSSLVIVSMLLYFIDVLSGRAIQWAVVTNVAMMKNYINEFTFLIFILFMIVAFRIQSKWSNRRR